MFQLNYHYHNEVLQYWIAMKSTPPNSKNELLNEYIFESKVVLSGHKMFMPKIIIGIPNNINENLRL